MKWQPYLTRPFDLFSTSLWQSWYDSEFMQESLGFRMDKVLCVQIDDHLVRQYRTKDQLRLLKRNFKRLLNKQPQKFKRLLKKGRTLTHQADAYLKSESKAFKNFDQAIHFFNEVIFFTTVFPNFPSIALDTHTILPKSTERLLVSLRRTFYYSLLMKKIIIPMALERAKKKHILRLVTVNELLSDTLPVIIKQRTQISEKKFIYQKIKGKETIEWISNPQRVIRKFEDNSYNQKEIKGFSAYPGKIRGRVHLVLDFTKPGIMKKGNILVSINTNPSLLPFMKRASAIVSDEGGITSHAAIVSRELKKPCVIGTKIATDVLRNGDMVEVDAIKGIVRKIV